MTKSKKKIELLVDLDENGHLISRPFDSTATVQPTRKTTRQADISEEVDYRGQEDDEADFDKEAGFDGDESDDGFDNADIDDPNSLF